MIIFCYKCFSIFSFFSLQNKKPFENVIFKKEKINFKHYSRYQRKNLHSKADDEPTVKFASKKTY